MTRRMYVDEDPSDALGNRLGESGLDATTTRLLGHKGRTDPWQLAYAARERRIFVTCNFKDFEMLHEAWTSWSAEWGIGERVAHAGILVIPNGSDISVNQMVAIISEILERESSLDNRFFRWRHSTGWVEQFPGGPPPSLVPPR